jgi:uncharacterized protein (DUF433 family)
MNPICVQSLRIESVSGPTRYSGEKGFSALTAYVKADDLAVVDCLRRAAEDETVVIIRSANLEVIGRVGKYQFTADIAKDTVSMAVEELRHSKPGSRLRNNRPVLAVTMLRNLCDCIVSDPELLGGEPVFKGTRVPVRSLFEHLRSGVSLESFLDDFEGVTKEQADAILDLAESNILQQIPRQ